MEFQLRMPSERHRREHIEPPSRVRRDGAEKGRRRPRRNMEIQPWFHGILLLFAPGGAPTERTALGMAQSVPATGVLWHVAGAVMGRTFGDRSTASFALREPSIWRRRLRSLLAARHPRSAAPTYWHFGDRSTRVEGEYPGAVPECSTPNSRVVSSDDSPALLNRWLPRFMHRRDTCSPCLRFRDRGLRS